MAVSEVPLSITEPKQSHTSYDYFAHKYGHKTAMEFKEDLNAIERSLHTAASPKMRQKTSRRHKKAKRFPSLTLVPNLEDISENESLSTEFEVEQKKDLAEIHKERAISSGNYARQEGRSFRHKYYHKSPKD